MSRGVGVECLRIAVLPPQLLTAQLRDDQSRKDDFHDLARKGSEQIKGSLREGHHVMTRK